MKKPRLFFAFIFLLTVLAVYIVVPPVKGIPGGIHVHLGSFSLTRDFPFQKGLDLQGGTSITLKADMSKIKEADRSNALQTAESVIARRINLYGVKEPVVQTARVNGDYRIVVELP